MHITYCIPSLYNSGGMERVLTLKANYLVDVLGWSVSIITTSQKERPPFYELSPQVHLVDLGVDYELISDFPIIKKIMARRRAAIKHKRKLGLLLREIKPDITVSMFTHEMAFLPTIKDGSRKVLELHFSKKFRILDATSKNMGGFKRFILNIAQWRDNRAIKHYDRFVVLTDMDAHDWKMSNINVIPNPTPFEQSPLCDYESKRILAVGRFCPQKGFDMLVRAWSLIPRSIRQGWHIDIVGSGPYENQLRTLIIDSHMENTIHLCQPSKNISSIYASHSVFCFPSRYEGFPMTLLEAESHGLPAIAFDCPCGPSDLIKDNDNGFLVKLGDVSSFADKMAKLICSVSLRKRLGTKAQAYVLNNYTQNHVMQQWQDLFCRVIKK